MLQKTPADAKLRAMIIFNPTAGRRRRKLDNFVGALNALNIQTEINETSGPGDATNIARSANKAEWDVVIAAGGDGTINEIVNGLDVHSPALAILPLGTANVLALELGLPSSPQALAALIESGSSADVYLPTANGRSFVLMAGIGFDAHVVDNMQPAFKRRFGKLAYVLLTFAGLRQYSRTRYSVVIDGKPYTAATAIAANGHYYGGRFICASQATLFQPSLHVCLFQCNGPWNAMRYAAGLVTGRLASFPDVQIVPAKRIDVQGPAGEPVQGDGDIVARLPVEILAAHQAIRIICPLQAGR